jgi:glutamate formiminotransferase/formiminotetrahydrofolate cyclodeaminase
MSDLVSQSVVDLLRSFSSPTPTPGGGSASALVGSLGAALLSMVAGMPKTRTGAPAERQALDAVLEPLLNGRDHLASLVDRDSESYEAVVAAYRLPKGTDAEKEARSSAIAGALRGATEVPLDVMRACHAAAREGLAVAAGGNRSASSDVGVGFDLLEAALRGAARNGRINLQGLKDAGYVSGVEDEAGRLEASMQAAVADARHALG